MRDGLRNSKRSFFSPIVCLFCFSYFSYSLWHSMLSSLFLSTFLLPPQFQPIQCSSAFASVLWDRKAQVVGLRPARVCVCMSVCYSLELLFSACPCGGDTTPLADLRGNKSFTKDYDLSMLYCR